ncbi:MAG: chromate transporter [Candidatus Cloacimonetes bacterium]|nr:chromate transporter [Candidatus Cloacimonadota bacterium]MCK9331922.1 chromate transporter [Candidatus Cloacimonadota bacterium]MDD2210524.1 chromate transporter [Candidatus Cloacimonadota bacterium]MDD3283217.1 chromate transporter [Candidatus Cloacimonadota bacterium]MDD4232485.1 chromate transporter [Candidatus Cloacimonadota bacterium]
MTLINMLFVFFKIGLFSFGGGYAILAMIQQEVVFKHAWLNDAEFVQVVALSQMTPGPIAINAATFIGFQKAGVIGSLLCTFGVILPSLIIMFTITVSYLKLKKLPWFQQIFKRLRLLSVGLIAAALIMIMGNAVQDWFSVVVFGACFLATWRFRLNPFTMLMVAAVFGMVFGSA